MLVSSSTDIKLKNRKTDSETDTETLPHPKQSSSPKQPSTGSHSLLLQRTLSKMRFLDAPLRLEHSNEIKVLK